MTTNVRRRSASPSATKPVRIMLCADGLLLDMGEPERAERLLAKMDTTLRELSARQPSRVIRVAGWDGAGTVPSEDTLFAAILHAAGGENIAATTGLVGNYFGMERLLFAHPDVLAYGAATQDRPSHPQLDVGKFALLAHARR